MDDQTAPAPTTLVETTIEQAPCKPFTFTTFVTVFGAALFLSSFAQADPLLFATKALSEGSHVQQMGFGGERMLLGTLTLAFSLLAGGVWHRSFRADSKPKRPHHH